MGGDNRMLNSVAVLLPEVCCKEMWWKVRQRLKEAEAGKSTAHPIMRR